MTDSPKDRPSAAPCTGGRAWELMYEVFKASKPFMESVAGTFELTPQQMFSLRVLSNERPMAMSELAGSLGCDASNVTAIVDRLEARGLVERRSADRDRRVKALIMTAAGVELAARIHERMQVPPPAIANLGAGDLTALCDILTRALASLEGAPAAS
ncbi:MAG: MarR family transcriptional regulator [Vulcanimicrobiaceae bacterium]